MQESAGVGWRAVVGIGKVGNRKWIFMDDRADGGVRLIGE
jgi:hypothetical protein